MSRKGKRVEAVAYMRTSSATNVGAEKDSEQRQRAAIEAHARRAGFVIVDWFYDPAVSGADPIESRPGFAALLARVASNGARTIIVETASRFARDIIVQEVGFKQLQTLGVQLIATDSPDSFIDDTPTATLIRQVLGAVAQFDKAMLVAKLKGARDRKKAKTGKCEGRKPYAETNPETVRLAKGLRAQRMSLRKISVELAAKGHLTRRGNGRPYTASAIQAMISS